jgi:hypothetical protein
LAGSSIDAVDGMSPFGLFNVPQATVELSPERSAWNRQLAIGLLEYRKQDAKRELQIVELDPSDPWRPIYAACLGLIPDAPTESVLRELCYVPELTFEDFLRIDRVWTAGSAEDLLARLEEEQHLTPRQVSMIFLPTEVAAACPFGMKLAPFRGLGSSG